MPFVDVTIVEGRSPEQVRALMHELHAATVRALDADPAAVRVVVREVPATRWSSGDVTIAERRSAQQPPATPPAGEGS